MEKLDRITINPNVCLGQPTIRNMRITVSFVIKMLASTRSIQAVLEAYPELEAEDIQQALEYASYGENKPVNLFGFLAKRVDPLEWQKEMRKEWDRY